MAYSNVYRTQSQNSNPAMTAIDGIGMKINELLVPPPMVTIPPEYQPGNPSEILFMEYDFSGEEHVLKWSQQERENEDAMRQAATQRVGDSIQTFSQTVELPDPTPAAPPISSNGAEQNAAQRIAPAPSNPFINLGSTILTPMPIGPSHIRKASGGSKNQTGFFDLTDFENEQDPFENMELKVLNDREELNKMIFEVQPLPPTSASADMSVSDTINSNHASVEEGEGQDAGRPSPPCTPINLQDVDYPDVESLDSGQYPLQQQQQPAVSQQYTAGQAQVLLQTSAHQAYYQPPQTAVSSSMPYPNQGVTTDTTYPFTQNMPLPPIPNSQYLVQHNVSTGPNYIGASSVSMASTASSVACGQPGTASVTLSSAGNVTYTPQLGDKGYMPYQNYYSRHSGSNHNTNTANGHLLTHPDSSQSPGAQGSETPPLNPLRSARSTPDISGSDQRRLPPLMPSSHTPPPTARPYSPNDFSSSSSQPPRPADNQNWNHYSILPSTPRSSTNTPTSAKSVANAKPKLPNPFDNLPHDAQRYVESVTDMGFPRARVARAVQKLGNDDKTVIDHLCMVNRLSEQGHNGDDAETALLLFENNTEKAEQYLKLLSQFKEIGFIEDKIQEALVSTNLDENKTLDLLTAS